MQLGLPQPAYKLYPFDRGWRVMGYVQKNIWTRTARSSQGWFDFANNRTSAPTSGWITKYWNICLALGARLGGSSQYVTSMIFVALFFAIQASVLAIWAGLDLIPIGLLMGGTWLYSRVYGIFYRCPDCHVGMPIPVFICPGCGAEHTRLWPSVYGIFTHTCKTCSTKLPTLEWAGRSRLIRVCPNPECHKPLNVGVGIATNVHIPVIGGRAAGKTNYIVAATNEFIHAYAEPRNYNVTFTDKGHESMFSARVGQLNRGQELEATREIVPQAYNLLIKSPRRHVPHIAYVYDAAGEAYSTTSNTERQVYYKYVHGIIFIIDPFSIPRVRQMHASDIERVRMSLRPSTLDAMTAYANMTSAFEASVGLRPNELFPHPIAVVVSKVDALNLEREIGVLAAQGLMARDPRITLEEDAISILVRDFLLRNGLDNFVRAVELQFRNVKYFSCSALGRLPSSADGSPFRPVRVLEPFTWLLGNTNTIDSLRERRKKVDELQRAQSRLRGGIAAQRAYYWDSLHPVDPEEEVMDDERTLSAV